VTAPGYLTLDEVLAIHADQIERYGGSLGIRDLGALESALAIPRAGFGGELMHPTLFEQTAAYLFHLARNHPFLDGNQRVALATALVFLALNDVEIDAGEDDIVELVLGVATGTVSKAAIAELLRAHATR
jgi:death-on-curing protein